ncbi:MAG: hypothetical protein ACK5HU_04305 [Flavobacteriales bacterium]
MREIVSVFLVLVACLVNAQNNVGVGIGNESPNGVLDLTHLTSNSKIYPLRIPVATSENVVVNPTEKPLLAGSLFYDLTARCLKVYDGTKWGCVTF